MNKDINAASMLRVGTVLHGTYRIDGYLSSGGFGNTYVATNIQFDERYAIKEFFMKGVSQRDDNNTTVSVSNSENRNSFSEQLEKFKKEARRLRKLKSNHIVRVYDLFEENGTAYYVMDFIQGENLAERLKRIRKPLSEDETLSIIRQVLDALDTAHGQGIWHLDLKPANIMIDADGTAKLIDFGASKQQSSKGGATSSTAVSYTNGYAPREQMEQNLDKFGPWTDLYALGATAYTLLTNQKPPLPSDIDDDRSADKHLALPMPQEVSEKTRHLVLWLMSTSRLDRPQTVRNVINYLNDSKEYFIEDDPSDGYPKTDYMPKNKPSSEETVIGDNTIRGKKPNTQPQKHNDVEPKPQKPTSDISHVEEPLIEPEKPQPNASQVSSTEYVDNSTTSSNGMRKFIAVIVVIAISVGIYFALRGGNSSHPSDMVDSTEVEMDTSVTTKVTNAEMDTAGLFMACRYTGEVKNGLPNGYGEAWYANKSYYKGHFSNGVMEGEDGFFRFDNGDTFTGSFHENHFVNGKYTSKADNSYFEGSFNTDGQPLQGVWYDKNGNKIQSVGK